jgi:DNA-binding transcriptional LysR family regulator
MVSVANPLAGGELAAFEAGSVHGAADALQLTQSAVTKRIQMLERRVGGRLFERGRFGVRPTELGRTVYPAAKRALEALDSVAQLVELSRAAGSMDLRLSASLTIGEFLLPGWLADFRRERPEVHPQLEIVNSQGVIDAIRENRAARSGSSRVRTLPRASRPSPSLKMRSSSWLPQTIRGLAGVPSRSVTS